MLHQKCVFFWKLFCATIDTLLLLTISWTPIDGTICHLLPNKLFYPRTPCKQFAFWNTFTRCEHSITFARSHLPPTPHHVPLYLHHSRSSRWTVIRLYDTRDTFTIAITRRGKMNMPGPRMLLGPPVDPTDFYSGDYATTYCLINSIRAECISFHLPPISAWLTAKWIVSRVYEGSWGAR